MASQARAAHLGLLCHEMLRCVVCVYVCVYVREVEG